MNFRAPGRADALASAYVLGTLRGRARARFDRVLHADPVVSDVVRQWEERLLPLAEALPPVAPPARVWSATIARIRAEGGAPLARGSAWTNLALWRGLALTALAAVLALAVGLLVTAPERREGTLVAVLAAQDAKPVAVASADRTGRSLTVKLIAPVELAANRTLQLWALPEGGNPRPLGLLPATGIVRLTLSSPAEQTLRDVPTLAVSLEPQGGSPTGLPTGPVLFTGPVQRLY